MAFESDKIMFEIYQETTYQGRYKVVYFTELQDHNKEFEISRAMAGEHFYDGFIRNFRKDDAKEVINKLLARLNAGEQLSQDEIEAELRPFTPAPDQESKNQAYVTVLNSEPMGFWRKKVIQPALDSETESTLQEQQELLRKDPSNPRAYFALGSLAHLRGETAAAIEYFKKAIELDPAYAAPHANLGRIYAVQGDYELAWEHARAAEHSGDRSLVDQLERYANTTRPPANEAPQNPKTPQENKTHL